ncbi:MAG: hypothetical protein IRZ16_01275 [Myxococcaceae bacterium]|nr:hypothetical protein [Myxococcaceae bacterium]
MIRPTPILVAFAALAAIGCGPAWQPAFDANGNWYLNVGGPSATDVYAVGGTTDVGSIRHFDGSAWTEVDPGVDVPLLNWVHAFSPNDVWIAGNAGTLLHFDGQNWTKATPLTDQPLWGIWGAAPDDVWAVGGSGFSSGSALLLHYDGTTWTPKDVPPLSRENVFAFYKVWGTSAQDVFVVGQDGVVIHFDGTGWTDQPSGAKDDLISLWGTGPHHVVAVGGRGNGIVAEWNGSEWKTTSLAPLPGLNGVWMDSDDAAWVAGTQGTLGALDLSSKTLDADEVEDSTLDFHSIFGSGDRLWSVGGNLAVGASTGKFRGIALERTR